MAGVDLPDRKENRRKNRRNSKSIIFPESYYTINRTTTTTTTLELNYRQRNSIMTSSSLPSEGVTALMLACLQGRVTDVQVILKKNKEPYKSKTKSGKIPLHFCAEGGNVRCLELIITADPTLINTRDEENYTPIHLAVINGHKEIVKALIAANADINCVDNEKHSLVHWATVCGELEILDILLNSGAPASTPDIHLAHPIHYSSQMCGNGNGRNMDTSRARVQSTVYGVSPKKGLTILRRLIQHGVPIDVKDKDGRQPLLWAGSAGSADGILSLVNAGASVQAADKDGLTALHCAASRGHTDCLETLIALCGAEVDVIDNNGCTATFYAVTLGHADCTELLLNFGAEPNRQDRKGRTPAHCGASKGQLETIKLFAKHGGNLWMKNVRGDLPLHEAIISRRKDLVLWLLSQKLDAVNASNNDGRCSIHLASLNNNVEMVKILIDYHAEVNPLMRTGKGTLMTPLDAAIHKGNSAVAKFLQLHGGLPANSLNDSSLQRRMNRTLESQARSLSSLRGSQLEHHESSPDRDFRQRFISPEVTEQSILHQYADSVVASILKQSLVPTSTPIMDDWVQTDNSPYVRDVQVQVSNGFDVETNGESSKTLVTPGDTRRSSSSKGSEKKVRKKRKSISRDKSPATAINDSTDSGEKVDVVGASRMSRIRQKGIKNKTPPSSETQSSEPTTAIDQSKIVIKSTGLTQVDSTVTTPSAVLPHSKLTEIQSQPSPPIREIQQSTTQDSDTYNNDSEKFSELENVAIQSSENEIRDEELGVLEEDSKVLNSKPEPKSSTPKSLTPKSIPGEIYESDEVHKQNEVAPMDLKVTVDDPNSEDRKIMSTVQEDSKEYISTTTTTTTTSSFSTTGKTSTNRSTSKDSSQSLDKSKNDDGEFIGHVELVDVDAELFGDTEFVGDSDPVDDVDSAAPPKEYQQKTQLSIATRPEAQKIIYSSATSKESRYQETEIDESYRFDEGQEISLQEAYARRRKSKSKRSDSLNDKSTDKVQKQNTSDAHTKSIKPINKPSRTNKMESFPKSSASNDDDMTISAKSTRRLSVREQFKANREMLEKRSASLATKSDIAGKSLRVSARDGSNYEDQEILLQEEMMNTTDVRGSSKDSINSTRLRKQQTKIPKSNIAVAKVQSHYKQKIPQGVSTSKLLEINRQRNLSEGKTSTHSEDTTQSWKRDSGYSDQLLHTTSASEDQNRLNLTAKSTGSLRRKVVTRRPGSSSFSTTNKKNGNLITSAKKKIPESRILKDRRRFDTVGVQQRPRLPPLENGSAGSTSQGGSITSDDGHKTKDVKWRANRPRSKLTFTKGENLQATMSPYTKRNMDVDTPISVTQAMQASMRKYQLERKIFQELLELKRLQIRAGKANEQILVKRLADGYKKAGLSINYREYDGAYTFRNFEKYLYDQLRLLQANRKLLPRFAPSDDLEKLSLALKKMNATKLPFLDDFERPESTCLDETQCTHMTHRCHHASHAYVGIPCAAYISKGRRTPFLPKVDPVRAPGPTNLSRTPQNIKPGVQMIISPRGDSTSPITVEVQQGSTSQVFSLPNNSLDPTKNYYVSLSIKPSPSPSQTPRPNPVTTTTSSSLGHTVNVQLDDSGSLSAPPPPSHHHIST